MLLYIAPSQAEKEAGEKNSFLAVEKIRALGSGWCLFATATEFENGMSACGQTCRGRGWTVTLRDGEDLRTASSSSQLATGVLILPQLTTTLRWQF